MSTGETASRSINEWISPDGLPLHNRTQQYTYTCKTADSPFRTVRYVYWPEIAGLRGVKVEAVYTCAEVDGRKLVLMPAARIKLF